jgi:hypothetical protein
MCGSPVVGSMKKRRSTTDSIAHRLDHSEIRLSLAFMPDQIDCSSMTSNGLALSRAALAQDTTERGDPVDAHAATGRRLQRRVNPRPRPS